jgi:hypothetical protein
MEVEAPPHHQAASGCSDGRVRIVWGCRWMSPLDIEELRRFGGGRQHDGSARRQVGPEGTALTRTCTIEAKAKRRQWRRTCSRKVEARRGQGMRKKDRLCGTEFYLGRGE